MTNKFVSNKKYPIIPPVLVNGEIISDFKQKPSFINYYFPSQCTPMYLDVVTHIQTVVIKLKKILTSFDIKDDDILPITKNLNVDKVHGWDQLSIKND